MRRMRWIANLWPGLPQLAAQGSWTALGVAVVGAGLLNLSLVSSLVWTELTAPILRVGVWAATAGLWIGAAGYTFFAARRAGNGVQPPGENTFERATEHYLKGEWFATEQVLVELLRVDPRDVDARLMLATLLRHRGRGDEAARHLDELERCDWAVKWEPEIRKERELLAASGAAIASEETESEDTAKMAGSDPQAEMARAA